LSDRAHDRPLAFDVPVVLACAFVLLMTAVGTTRRLVAPQPRSPWDAALVVDAWRVACGEPQYPPAESERATHMYGPLSSHALAPLLLAAGPNTYSGRLLSLLSSLALVALLTWLSVRDLPRRGLCALFACTLFVGLNSLTNYYFTVQRPDMRALLLGALALIALRRGHERLSVPIFSLGVGLVLLALSQEQTMAAVAVLGVLPAALDTRATLPRRVVWALAPSLAVVAAVVGLRLAAPNAFHFMFTIPAGYSLLPGRLLEGVVDLPLHLPVLLGLAVLWVRRRPPTPDVDPIALRRDRLWLGSMAAVLVGTSLLAKAKIGGAGNSYFPALLFLCYVATRLFGRVLAPLATEVQGARRLALGVGCGALLLVTFPQVAVVAVTPVAHADYPLVLAAVANSDAQRVVAPEDPLIPLLARGETTPSLYLLRDKQGWDYAGVDPGAGIAGDLIKGADAVVDRHDWYDDLINPALLSQAGFERAESWDHYTLWVRKR
jgi:hypothetical protein